jgi:hypothetical protein
MSGETTVIWNRSSREECEKWGTRASGNPKQVGGVSVSFEL